MWWSTSYSNDIYINGFRSLNRTNSVWGRQESFTEMIIYIGIWRMQSLLRRKKESMPDSPLLTTGSHHSTLNTHGLITNVYSHPAFAPGSAIHSSTFMKFLTKFTVQIPSLFSSFVFSCNRYHRILPMALFSAHFGMAQWKSTGSGVRMVRIRMHLGLVM